MDFVQPISEAVVRAWTHPVGGLVIALQWAGGCGRRWRLEARDSGVTGRQLRCLWRTQRVSSAEIFISAGCRWDLHI